MNVMDLVAKISLDSQDFDKGLNDSESAFSSFGSNLASGAKTVGKVAVGAIAAVGTAVVGTTAAFVSNAKQVAAYADDIQKSSQKYGMTAESFQEWSFIMEHSGSSIDAVKGAMIKLGKAAESDSEAFKQLGINQEEFAQMGSSEQWEMAVAALQGVSDETERAALAQELFGKSYQELMPLLNTSAEETAEMKQQVHDLGGVMSDDAVNAGAQFQDSLLNMQTALSGLKNNAMAEFLPSMSTMMDGLASIFSGDSGGIAKIKEGIEGLATKLNEALPKAIETVSGIAESLLSALPAFAETIAQQLPSILERGIPLIMDVLVKLSDIIIEVLPKIIEAIEKNISTITSGLSKIILSIGQIIIKLFPKVFPMLIKVGVQLITELARGITENIDIIIQSIIEVVNVVIQELTNPDTLMTLLDCGLQLLLAIIQGIINNLPQLIESLFTLLGNVTQFLLIDAPPKILNAALDAFNAIGDGAIKAGSYILGKIGDLLSDILSMEGIGKWFNDIYDNALGIFENIGNAVGNAFGTIQTALTEFGQKIWNGIKDGIGDMFEHGKKLVEQIVKGIKSVWHTVTDALNPKNWGSGGFSDEALERAKAMRDMGADDANAYYEGQLEGYDIHSPSRKMEYVGEMVMAGFNNGLQEENDLQMNPIDLPDVNIGDINRANGRDPVMARLDAMERMMQQIAQMGFNVTIPVSVGDRQIDEIYVDSKQRLQKRSGGQVDG